MNSPLCTKLIADFICLPGAESNYLLKDCTEVQSWDACTLCVYVRFLLLNTATALQVRDKNFSESVVTSCFAKSNTKEIIM